MHGFIPASYRCVPRMSENGENMILNKDDDRKEDQISEMLRERDHRYGTYDQNSDFAENVKYLFHYHKNWKSLPNWIKYTIDMLIVKLSRIISGDPLDRDSWIDLVGYAKLGLIETEKTKQIELNQSF